MKRKRPETTVYLGDEALKKLNEYRNTFAQPPSISAVVREAVEKYLDEVQNNVELPSSATWVEVTEAQIMRLRATEIQLPAEVILQAIDVTRDERTSEMLKPRGEYK